MSPRSLNAVYSKASMSRRYEVWFLRLTLADGSGAWWFRYLLLNPGRAGGGGCPRKPGGLPVQLWATWFPRGGRPQSFIQGFLREKLCLSGRGASPFHLQIGAIRIGESACAGCVEAEGHRVEWDLRYNSSLGTTVTDVGWIGFSRTPHSDAVFSGSITLDARTVAGDPLGHGLQGHNCGFRHRHLWNWTHCLFRHPASGDLSTFEALEYEIPFGQRVRRALLWHRGELVVFKRLEELARDPERLLWVFKCHRPEDSSGLVAFVDGRGPSLHRLSYLKTDCSGTFEVANNSLARATLQYYRPGLHPEVFSTDGGAVLEMVGK